MANPPHGSRLKFIDMARSVAILMMLEGHFVGVVLADTFRNPGHPAYNTWNHIRGLAAPMFFFSSGLVFVYLLTGNHGPRLLDLPRVRKGLLRAFELIAWGYLLQLNLSQLADWQASGAGSWLGAFHVLQCIGVALLLLIAIFAIQRKIPAIPLFLCYLLAALLTLLLHAWLFNLPPGLHFPPGFPAFLQNPLHGPRSVFPLAPWLVFPFYGAAFGSLLRRHPLVVRKPAFPFVLIALGVLLVFTGWAVDRLITLPFEWALPTQRTPVQWIHARFGEIIAILGLLVLIENRFPIRDSWFLKVGQNTLPIYILHVIILYGGIFGIGLGRWLGGNLNPWQSAAGALLFMAAFSALAVAIENRKRRAKAAAIVPSSDR